MLRTVTPQLGRPIGTAAKGYFELPGSRAIRLANRRGIGPTLVMLESGLFNEEVGITCWCSAGNEGMNLNISLKEPQGIVFSWSHAFIPCLLHQQD